MPKCPGKPIAPFLRDPCVAKDFFARVSLQDRVEKIATNLTEVLNSLGFRSSLKHVFARKLLVENIRYSQ
jgi:hypothetical protein